MFWTTWKIVHLVIERFWIQSAVSFWTVNIDNVTYKEFNNISVYDIIRDKKKFKNSMLSSILIE